MKNSACRAANIAGRDQCAHSGHSEPEKAVVQFSTGHCQADMQFCKTVLEVVLRLCRSYLSSDLVNRIPSSRSSQCG